MTSTAAHHAIDITGGRINLHIFTGNVSMDVVANTHLESLPTMLTPFLPPQDNFQDITLDNSNHNFSTDERSISSNNQEWATQTSLTMAISSVSDESSNFQDRVASSEDLISGNIPDSAFTIPLTLSTIEPTGTVSFLFPEQSLTTLLTNRTILKSSSSTENTYPSHSENTSQISPNTEVTKAERPNTAVNMFSWLKVEETVAASVILRNTSPVTSSEMLSTLRTTYSSPSLLLTAVTSSSPTTVLPTIPLIPVETLTNNQTSEIIISVPVTSRIPESFISTSSIAGSDVVTKVVFSEKKYPVQENREYVQTDFIEFSWDTITESSVPMTTTATVIVTTVRTGRYYCILY